jgi:hypothetical protein
VSPASGRYPQFGPVYRLRRLHGRLWRLHRFRGPSIDRRVEVPGEDGIVPFEKVLGQRRARCHTPQLLQLAERTTQIVELGPDILAQLGGHTAEIVTGLPQCGRGPADGTRKPLRAKDHQPDHDEYEHFPPADVGEHLTGIGVWFHRQRDVATITDHLYRRVLPNGQ